MTELNRLTIQAKSLLSGYVSTMSLAHHFFRAYASLRSTGLSSPSWLPVEKAWGFGGGNAGISLPVLRMRELRHRRAAVLGSPGSAGDLLDPRSLILSDLAIVLFP